MAVPLVRDLQTPSPPGMAEQIGPLEPQVLLPGHLVLVRTLILQLGKVPPKTIVDGHFYKVIKWSCFNQMSGEMLDIFLVACSQAVFLEIHRTSEPHRREIMGCSHPLH